MLEGVTFDWEELEECELAVELEPELSVEVLLVVEDVDDISVDVELELGVWLGLGEELDLPLPDFSDTTMLAFSPGGTVTTQNWAPPAPLSLSSPVTSLTPFSPGLILQGRPLQPLPSHSISTP